MKKETYSGIYLIINTISGKMYVGSSQDIKKRFIRHKSSLDKGYHHSPHLQKSWYKHGKKKFIFSIVELCDKTSLVDREQFWINTIKPEYNILPLAGSVVGHKWSNEAKAAHSLKYIGKPHGHVTNNRPVVQLDLENKEINRFSSIIQAKKQTGIGHISEVCRLKDGRSTAGGYKWKYL